MRSSAAFVASNAKNVFINAAIIPSCASKVIILWNILIMADNREYAKGRVFGKEMASG